MKTCKEKALEWNVSPRSVNDMCKKGRIQGAIKEKGSWLIQTTLQSQWMEECLMENTSRKIWLRKQKLNHYQSVSLTMFVRKKNITMSTRRY